LLTIDSAFLYERSLTTTRNLL